MRVSGAKAAAPGVQIVKQRTKQCSAVLLQKDSSWYDLTDEEIVNPSQELTDSFFFPSSFLCILQIYSLQK